MRGICRLSQRNAEVGDLRQAVRTIRVFGVLQQHICRLQVQMQNSLIMHVLDGCGQSECQPDGLLGIST